MSVPTVGKAEPHAWTDAEMDLLGSLRPEWVSVQRDGTAWPSDPNKQYFLWNRGQHSDKQGVEAECGYGIVEFDTLEVALSFVLLEISNGPS